MTCFRFDCLPLLQTDSQTALHMAAEKDHTDIVNALLAAGANVSATAVRELVSCVCVFVCVCLVACDSDSRYCVRVVPPFTFFFHGPRFLSCVTV
jgi:ankyrin repeat protein